jgi:glycosyltransferase involved in cell wall biosynthesis
MSPVRVLIIVPEVECYGGTLRFLEQLLEMHAERGITTAVLIPEGPLFPAVTALLQRMDVEILTSNYANTPATHPFATPLNDLRFALRPALAWRPDLLVVSTGNPGSISIALYFPVPVLYVLHTIPEARFRFLPRLYLRLGSLLGNRIMTVSRAAREAIVSTMGFSADRVAVVHNSCSPCELTSSERQPLVLTVGHLAPYKNPEGWLSVARKVVAQNSAVRFAWLGDGELLGDISRQIQKLGLADRILLCGYIEDTSTWFDNAQVYFQPSLRESHGIAVLEAMSHGLPCVVANTGGLPESVVDGETGYVCPPGEEDQFAMQILKLLGDPSLCRQLGSAGLRLLGSRFSPREQQQKIIALYTVLSRRKVEP